MRKGILVIAVILVMFTFVSTASAAYYACKVVIINPKETELVIQVNPGTGETRFQGTARVTLPDSSAGTKMLAVILTAVSLGYEVSLNCANVPSSTPQQVTAVSLNIP